MWKHLNKGNEETFPLNNWVKRFYEGNIETVLRKKCGNFSMKEMLIFSLQKMGKLFNEENRQIFLWKKCENFSIKEIQRFSKQKMGKFFTLGNGEIFSWRKCEIFSRDEKEKFGVEGETYLGRKHRFSSKENVIFSMEEIGKLF